MFVNNNIIIKLYNYYISYFTMNSRVHNKIILFLFGYLKNNLIFFKNDRSILLDINFLISVYKKLRKFFYFFYIKKNIKFKKLMRKYKNIKYIKKNVKKLMLYCNQMYNRLLSYLLYTKFIKNKFIHTLLRIVLQYHYTNNYLYFKLFNTIKQFNYFLLDTRIKCNVYSKKDKFFKFRKLKKRKLIGINGLLNKHNKKKLHIHVLYKTIKSNTWITIIINNKMVYTISSGLVGYKKSNRSSYLAANQLGYLASRFIQRIIYKNLSKRKWSINNFIKKLQKMKNKRLKNAKINGIYRRVLGIKNIKLPLVKKLVKYIILLNKKNLNSLKYVKFKRLIKKIYLKKKLNSTNIFFRRKNRINYLINRDKLYNSGLYQKYSDVKRLFYKRSRIFSTFRRSMESSLRIYPNFKITFEYTGFGLGRKASFKPIENGLEFLTRKLNSIRYKFYRKKINKFFRKKNKINVSLRMKSAKIFKVVNTNQITKNGKDKNYIFFILKNKFIYFNYLIVLLNNTNYCLNNDYPSIYVNKMSIYIYVYYIYNILRCFCDKFKYNLFIDKGNYSLHKLYLNLSICNLLLTAILNINTIFSLGFFDYFIYIISCYKNMHMYFNIFQKKNIVKLLSNYSLFIKKCNDNIYTINHSINKLRNEVNTTMYKLNIIIKKNINSLRKYLLMYLYNKYFVLNYVINHKSFGINSFPFKVRNMLKLVNKKVSVPHNGCRAHKIRRK